MKTKENERFHIGVYGILIQNKKILLIKKARGPYKGTFDLPGGGIEFEEKVEDTLKRELEEEAGITIKNFEFLGHNEYVSKYLSGVKPRTMHHLGLYYLIETSDTEIKEDPDGEDSLGSSFIDIADLSSINIAPIAKPMIKKALQKLKIA